MKISVLLPYKENFSANYAGAVSLFVKDTIQNSKYFKSTYVFGSTDFKKPFLIPALIPLIFHDNILILLINCNSFWLNIF